MREESVARRYAAALFAQAKAAGTVREVREDLHTVALAIGQTKALQAILEQSVVTQERKRALLRAAFGEKISPATLTFLTLLVDKRRIDLLSAVEVEYGRMAREAENIALATAQTAVQLSPAQLVQLRQSLEARTGKRIELRTEVNPELLGGVWVRIGDTVYDGSVRGNLERLRESLLQRA
jgi:F-type H+-transporting ATPase subunit delta